MSRQHGIVYRPRARRRCSDATTTRIAAITGHAGAALIQIFPSGGLALLRTLAYARLTFGLMGPDCCLL
jgi:hypothetical protein